MAPAIALLRNLDNNLEMSGPTYLGQSSLTTGVDMADNEEPDFTSLTVDLLSAYFASNSVESEQLASLIQTTHSALKGLGESDSTTVAGPQHVAAVSVRKSLSSPDHILSMIDGKPYKTLKRHLGTHGLSPEQYRERYNLPRDYPLVAKSYSEHRRKVAEQLGLGRKLRAKKAEAPASDVPAPVAATPKAKRTSAKSAAPAAVASPAATRSATPKKAPARKAKPAKPSVAKEKNAPTT